MDIILIMEFVSHVNKIVNSAMIMVSVLCVLKVTQMLTVIVRLAKIIVFAVLFLKAVTNVKLDIALMIMVYVLPYLRILALNKIAINVIK